MEYNEKIVASLDLKLKKCNEIYDFIALGFNYNFHISELEQEYDTNARIEIWSDGYYLIKVVDIGNGYFKYNGQYQK